MKITGWSINRGPKVIAKHWSHVFTQHNIWCSWCINRILNSWSVWPSHHYHTELNVERFFKLAGIGGGHGLHGQCICILPCPYVQLHAWDYENENYNVASQMKNTRLPAIRRALNGRSSGCSLIDNRLSIDVSFWPGSVHIQEIGNTRE